MSNPVLAAGSCIPTLPATIASRRAWCVTCSSRCPHGDVTSHHPSSGHLPAVMAAGAASSQAHHPCRVTGIPTPSPAVGSCSFARRYFPGRNVPAHNPSSSLCADPLMRSRFSRGSQALIPIKTFHLEPAMVQPAGYSSRRRAHGGPPTESGSQEVPAKPASGATACSVGPRAGGSFWSRYFQGDGGEQLMAWLHHRGLYLGGFLILRAGPAEPAGKRGYTVGQRGHGHWQPGANPPPSLLSRWLWIALQHW